MTQQTVLISEDLSGVGQVSLGVALPVLASLGYLPAIAPTAVLSTHLANLAAPTGVELAAQLPGILRDWQQLALRPAGLLLGYLGSAALSVWSEWLPRWQHVPVRVLDPVMADDGHLYRGFTTAYVGRLATLAQQAMVITPNYTEAQLLIGQPPDMHPVEAEVAQRLAAAVFAQVGCSVVVTGVPLNDGQLATVGVTTDSRWLDRQSRLAGHYFGTGDLFAAALTGALMAQQPLPAAAKLAETFVATAITHTNEIGGDPRLGLAYAAGLPTLQQALERKS